MTTINSYVPLRLDGSGDATFGSLTIISETPSVVRFYASNGYYLDVYGSLYTQNSVWLTDIFIYDRYQNFLVSFEGINKILDQRIPNAAADLLSPYSILSGNDLVLGSDYSDIIWGLGGNDELQGFDGLDSIDAGAGDDIIYGDNGNDQIVGGIGSDFIDGGWGIDTVFFQEYEDGSYTYWVTDPEHISVSHEATSEYDTMLDVERIVFSYFRLALDIGVGENAGTAYRTYQAAYDRVPDTAGLGFWIDQLDAGLSLKGMADYFLSSDEFEQIYGDSPSNRQIAAAMYENVLQRTPDKAGIDFWTDQLDKGNIDRADLLLYFADSNENLALVSDAISDGIWY